MHSVSNQRVRPTHISGRSRGGKRYRPTSHNRTNKQHASGSIQQLHTTKSKYRRKAIIGKHIARNEIYIDDNGSVQEYVDNALDLLAKKNALIYITATNGAISKATNCVEIIKRKKTQLHQESRIEIGKIKEIWEALEPHLKEVTIEYEVTYIKILLTFDCTLVNKHNIGYQTPLSLFDSDNSEIYNKLSKLQKKYDMQKEELSYTKELHKSLQNKYEMQQKDITIYMDKLDIGDGSKKQIKHLLGKVNKLQNKCDVQKQELDMMNVMRTRYCADFKGFKSKYDLQVEKYNILQEKYTKLQYGSNIIKTNEYYDFNATELVEFIINIDKKRYEKYRDVLLRGFIREG
eukprot:449439_1